MAKTTTKLHIQKQDGQPFNFDRHNQRAFDEFASQAPPGCYECEYKKTKKYKTHSQVKMIFGLMIDSTIWQADELGIGVEDLLVYLIDGNIPKGVSLTKEFLHELMYAICPTTNEKGERITLSKMSTIEANELFERFRNVMAPTGICIPEPNKNWNKGERNECE